MSVITDDIAELSAKWSEVKARETEAMQERRGIEDQLGALMSVPENHDGVQTVYAGDFRVKVTGRPNIKVDSGKLQELARENGLSEHLSTLFRWTPSIDKKAWKNTDKKITSKLTGAITTKSGRPSYNVMYEKE